MHKNYAESLSDVNQISFSFLTFDTAKKTQSYCFYYICPKVRQTASNVNYSSCYEVENLGRSEFYMGFLFLQVLHNQLVTFLV